MNIYIGKDKQDMARHAAAAAADKIRKAIAEKGEARIIVATGASQFEFLAELVAEPGIDWTKVTGFHLDEYVGLPVSLAYDVVDSKTLLFYCYAGGIAEKAISSQYFIYNLSSSPILSEKVPSLQYGVFGGIGVEFRVSDFIGLYVDPCVRYYFPGNQPKSIRTDRPLMFSFEAGLRFNL